MKKIVVNRNGRRIVINVPSYEEEEAAFIHQLVLGEAAMCDSAGSGSLPTPPIFLPFFTLQPIGQMLEEGTTLVLSVSAGPGGPQDWIHYQWYFGNNQLIDGGNVSGVLTSNLIINSVSPSDIGNYYCLAQNADGFTSSSLASVDVIGVGGNNWETNPFRWEKETQLWNGDIALWDNVYTNWEEGPENWETITTQ